MQEERDNKSYAKIKRFILTRVTVLKDKRKFLSWKQDWLKKFVSKNYTPKAIEKIPYIPLENKSSKTLCPLLEILSKKDVSLLKATFLIKVSILRRYFQDKYNDKLEKIHLIQKLKRHWTEYSINYLNNKLWDCLEKKTKVKLISLKRSKTWNKVIEANVSQFKLHQLNYFMNLIKWQYLQGLLAKEILFTELLYILRSLRTLNKSRNQVFPLVVCSNFVKFFSWFLIDLSSAQLKEALYCSSKLLILLAFSGSYKTDSLVVSKEYAIIIRRLDSIIYLINSYGSELLSLKGWKQYLFGSYNAIKLYQNPFQRLLKKRKSYKDQSETSLRASNSNWLNVLDITSDSSGGQKRKYSQNSKKFSIYLARIKRPKS